jgi:hypothetical protein
MDKNKLLQEMRDSVGTQNPIDFFKKFIDVFEFLFEKVNNLETELKRTRNNAALAIQWQPKIAAEMLLSKIESLRNDPNKEAYHSEISALKVAYAQGAIVKRYDTFCQFWQDILGYHPFLEY